ncbi:hypothetical protein IE077_003216 [Cardiosporidium cionae]|uniref:Uncharacterized protein n=1 Tax=Cardiosporidium cionae TaxID=476202 RepID=A0ABQ7J8T5_9APIC|nr:hypothetical protein IE077_003216 [Cardiosporidium cionae]|eukprot:KAF8820397.1 hypothetical protein IE077_003216 [Cardiosporidium cionae]
MAILSASFVSFPYSFCVLEVIAFYISVFPYLSRRASISVQLKQMTPDNSDIMKSLLSARDFSTRSLTKAFSWEELKEIAALGGIDALMRWPEVQKFYRQSMNNIKTTYESVDDYILITKFAYAEKYLENGKIQARPTEQAEMSTVNLCLNDFPYAIEEGLSHYILWSLKELSSDEANAMLRNEFDSALYDIIYFLNAPALQTVGSVHHWHIFVKGKM